MKLVRLAMGVLLVVLVGGGCAVRYKAGDSCWSFEMVSTEDWCEKQRVIDKVSRLKNDELLLEQIRQFKKHEEQP